MSYFFLGEIRLFGGDYAPHGWALCNGAAIRKDQNPQLYLLIRDIYGETATTFNLPDLQGRFPVHVGQISNGPNYVLGTHGGAEKVQLETDNLPAHTHLAYANSNPGNQNSPSSQYWAASALNNYTLMKPDTPMAKSILPSGGNLPHENMMPFQVINYIISLTGIFPSHG